MGWVVNATLRPLCLGKDPVSFLQQDGWAPDPVWTGAENLAHAGIRSPNRPARNESLNRLSYPGPYIFQKHSKIKFDENNPLMTELFHSNGETDRQTRQK
jgi:hypothetical protein